MKKPESLRLMLQSFVPALAADPSKLSLFVDKGRIAARAGSLGLEYRYTVNVVVQDYAGDADDLMVPVLAWIGQHQPELLHRADQEPFRLRLQRLGSARRCGWVRKARMGRTQPVHDLRRCKSPCGWSLTLSAPALTAPAARSTARFARAKVVAVIVLAVALWPITIAVLIAANSSGRR